MYWCCIWHKLISVLLHLHLIALCLQQRPTPRYWTRHLPPAAMASTRATRGSASFADELASMTIRDRLVFAQAVYEFGAGPVGWPQISKLLSQHPLLTHVKHIFSTQVCTRPQMCKTWIMVGYDAELSENIQQPDDPSSASTVRYHLSITQTSVNPFIK